MTTFPQPEFNSCGLDVSYINAFGIVNAALIQSLWGTAYVASLEQEMTKDGFFETSRTHIQNRTGISPSQQVYSIRFLSSLGIIEVSEDNGDDFVAKLNTDIIDKLAVLVCFGG